MMTVLAGDLKGMNTLAEPRKFAPVTTTEKDLGHAFQKTLPAHSVTVLSAR